MAIAPTPPNFTQYNWQIGDTVAMIDGWNGFNAAWDQYAQALVAFGNTMTQESEAAVQAAESTAADAEQTAQDRQVSTQAAQSATASEAQAKSSAEIAVGSAATAQAAANFKGRWSDLTGALSIPASVIHNNVYWQLLQDVSDITQHEPQPGDTWAGIEAIDKGYLTQSFTAGQQKTIPLSVSTTIPANISVTKEVPQTGLTNSNWNVATDGENYSVENQAYDTTLTPSGTTGTVTLTLGAGSFTSDDVGKTISGNGGVAILTNPDGTATVEQDFASTATIAAGDWEMVGVLFKDTGIELSGEKIGYQFVSGVEAGQSGIFRFNTPNIADAFYFKDSGDTLFLLSYTGEVFEYPLSTAWDVTTVIYSGVRSFNPGITDNCVSIFFRKDGDYLFILSLDDYLYEYALSTAWDIATATSTGNSFFTGAEQTTPSGIQFHPEGLKFLIIGTSPRLVHEYDMSVAWDITTAVYSGISFDPIYDIVGQPYALYVNKEGSLFFVFGSTGSASYTMSSPWQLSSAAYTGDSVTPGVTQNENGVWFSPSGDACFFLNAGGEVFQYDTFTLDAVRFQHFPAITNTLGQIDSTFWADLNSMTTTDSPNGQSLHYALSTDDRQTFVIFPDSLGIRQIARNDNGTWQYNSVTAYGSTVWVTASRNNPHAALSDAMSISANRMTSAQLQAASDADLPATGDTLDLAIVLYTDDSSATPTSDGVTINYDANALNEVAIPGTDYTWDQPTGTEVRFTAIEANNLKVRVL